jgi:hypothetical protein
MPVLFRRGQELKRGDLALLLKAKDGTPKNAAQISYSLYDFTTGVEVLIPPGNRTPENPAIGEYFANLLIPLDANLGTMRIRWKFREYLNYKEIEIVQEFAIVDNQVTAISNNDCFTAIENDLVRGLRILLRDANPARNYHFTPPAGEESVNKFTRVFGFIWEDVELLEFLRVSNDGINMYPPQTFYASLDQLIQQHRNWRTLLLTGAMVYAIQALTLNWILDEFTYSIGGVNLDLEKSSKYQSMMNDANERFKEFVENAKATVKVATGLRHSKFGVGIRSSFGPSVGRGSLTPRRFIGF